MANNNFDDFDLSDDGFGDDGFGDGFDDGFEEDSENEFDGFGESGFEEEEEESDGVDTSNLEYDTNDSSEDTDDTDGRFTNRMDIKKTAIYAIIIGIVGFIIVAIIIRISSASKNKNVEPTNVVETTNNDVPQIEDGEGGKQVELNDNYTSETTDNRSNNGENSENYTSGSVSNNDPQYKNYIEFQEDDGIELISENEGTFTITGIKHYAKIVDDLGTVTLVSRLTGSISGLSGTFDLEIPYSKGIRLNIGNVFSIKYKIGEKSEKQIIYDIDYK